jgi:hypothetical protein
MTSRRTALWVKAPRWTRCQFWVSLIEGFAQRRVGSRSTVRSPRASARRNLARNVGVLPRVTEETEASAMKAMAATIAPVA